MPGAIIPDDWDGSSYQCYKIIWPHSAQFEAILLGSVSKPAFLNYWDPDTGDEQEAADGVASAYNQTIPNFWTEDCEDVVLSTTGFRVRNSVIQTIPAVTWTKVIFDTFVWNHQPPTWNLAENAQDLTLPASAGIWQYNAGVVTTLPTRILLAIQLNNYYVIATSENSPNNRMFLNTAWDVSASWTWLNLWIYTEIAVDIQSIDDATPWFEGHLVRSVEVP